jgi:hypothetical protein
MHHRRRARSTLAGIVIVLGIAVLAPRQAAAASCAGPSHTMTLSAGTVSPGTGTAGSRFTFSVSYADSRGCAPDRIVVAIPGVGTYPLSLASGDLTGAVFSARVSLPAGRWPYTFEATSGTGVGTQTATFASVQPSQVVVLAPTSQPNPTPKPTPIPPPQPSPMPTPTLPASLAPASPSAVPSVPATASGSPPLESSPGASTNPSGIALAGAASPGGPGVVAASIPTAGVMDLAELPRPWAALLVSMLGTAIGLLLFGSLGRQLLGASTRQELIGPPRDRTPAATSRRSQS